MSFPGWLIRTVLDWNQGSGGNIYTQSTKVTSDRSSNIHGQGPSICRHYPGCWGRQSPAPRCLNSLVNAAEKEETSLQLNNNISHPDRRTPEHLPWATETFVPSSSECLLCTSGWRRSEEKGPVRPSETHSWQGRETDEDIDVIQHENDHGRAWLKKELWALTWEQQVFEISKEISSGQVFPTS